MEWILLESTIRWLAQSDCKLLEMFSSSTVSAAMASFRASRQLTRAQFTNLFEELSSAMEASEFREFADYLQSSFKVIKII